MNKVLEDIKNEKEYYDGLNKALYPDYTEIHRLMGDDGYGKEDYILYQQLIDQNPSDKRLIQAIKTDEYGLFLLCFFLYPLERVIRYAISNCMTIAAEQFLPPKYALFDAESICEELSKLKRLGRERIFNYYYDIDYRYSEKLRQAIMEPNVEIMCELLESNAIDLLWLQRTLGVMRYGIDLVDGVVNKTISEEDGYNLYGDFIKSLVDDEVPYINDYFRITSNEEFEGISITDVWGLYLKYYWYIYHSFREKTRTIIDAYINKPCFKDFVSKCRAEFEEDERLREEESNGGDIVDVDTEPVVEEVQKQAPQDNHINKKEKYNDNASDVAANTKRIHYSAKGLSTKGAASGGNNFQWSDSLKKWYEEHTGKFEDFVRYVAKDKGYIPNEQKQVNAFIRTITGRDVPNCDEKVRLLNNGRDDATRAMLYLKKCKIICSGDYCDIFTYFDVDRPERYREKPDDNSWMSGYARDADNDFKITVIETFNDFSGLKVPKEEQNLNIAPKKE